MRTYGIVSPMFWTGSTGKRLRTDRDAQVLAAYLMTSPHSHQTGIYYLPLMYAAHETGMTQEGASKALRRLIEEGFCEYDSTSEWVWVRNMAAWQIGTALSPTDKRCKGVQQYLETLPELPFVAAFIERYRSDFHLMGDARGLEAPSEGHSSNRTGPIQEQEQEGGTGETARSARGPSTEKPAKARNGKKPKITLPDSFVLDGELRAYAEKHLPQVDVEALFESFCGKARAKSWVYADWRQAWQEFCRNCAPNSGHWAAGQYPKRESVRWM